MKRYDFGLNWDGSSERFVDYLKAGCEENNLSFFWISGENVGEVIRELESHKLEIKVLLDTEATYNKIGDSYARVCYAVKDFKGVVINDPDRTKAAIDKSIAHYELMNARIATPYTVIVRNWEPDRFRLTNTEKKKLGTPFIIKPALGYGQLGVVRDARGRIREIATARNFDKGDNFLLQEKISPVELGNRRAWFRVFNVFDTIIPCWWDDHTNLYEHVLYEEFNTYGLYPLAKIASKIASISRLVWFSTEIAIDKKGGQSRFMAIDYVNDQCDMSTKSETVSGVPDGIVEYTAKRIVNAAAALIRGGKLTRKYGIFLKDATVELRGLGISQSPLKQIQTRKYSGL